MPTRKVGKLVITWSELEDILRQAEVLTKEESLKELTLVHPKELLIHIRRS